MDFLKKNKTSPKNRMHSNWENDDRDIGIEDKQARLNQTKEEKGH